jgi:hypothetical protein
MTRYRMDYLFGGFTEYAAEIAAQVYIVHCVQITRKIIQTLEKNFGKRLIVI